MPQDIYTADVTEGTDWSMGDQCASLNPTGRLGRQEIRSSGDILKLTLRALYKHRTAYRKLLNLGDDTKHSSFSLWLIFEFTTNSNKNLMALERLGKVGINIVRYHEHNLNRRRRSHAFKDMNNGEETPGQRLANRRSIAVLSENHALSLYKRGYYATVEFEKAASVEARHMCRMYVEISNDRRSAPRPRPANRQPRTP